jgi:carbonic anhydrase/acetyltransferase-like protein (isoleucine patch superfamily)
MSPRIRQESRSFRPLNERLESRLVMSGNNSVPAEVRAILSASHGGTPIRPNTPVLPLESAYATATFIDPSVKIIAGKRMAIGVKDYVAPNATLNGSQGLIVIGSTSAIEDDAQLIADPTKASNVTGIDIGDNVLIGDGAVIKGPSAIGAKAGAVTGIGPDAVIDGSIIEPGAYVGALARVGPGVTVPAGYEVLPGANVTTNAEADTPSLGLVVKVTSTSTIVTNTTKEIADSVALASGYATLYQGNSATGGAAIAGPIPSAVSAAGSTIFFGALNTVLGASSEPGSKNVTFEPASGTPKFLTAAGTTQAIAPNLSYLFPARFIGGVTVSDQGADSVASVLGKGDTIRADEGQPIKIGSIARIGNDVSIRSPLGGVQGITQTTVVTTTTDSLTGVTTKTTASTTATSSAAPTATAGTTTVTTTGINASGDPTTGTVVTTIGVKTNTLGGITIGTDFTADDNAVILGSPSATMTIGNDVIIGAGAVVSATNIGNGAVIGNGAYVTGSTIAAGAIVPNGAIMINNVIVGYAQT